MTDHIPPGTKPTGTSNERFYARKFVSWQPVEVWDRQTDKMVCRCYSPENADLVALALNRQPDETRGGSDTARMDWLERHFKQEFTKGYAWASIAFQAVIPIRDQLDEHINRATSGPALKASARYPGMQICNKRTPNGPCLNEIDHDGNCDGLAHAVNGEGSQK